MGRRIPPREPGDRPVDPGDEERVKKDPSNYAGHEILSLGSARAILARLIDGDPFEIEARCIERLGALALLLDVRRVHLRTIARVAHAAPRYRGDPPLAQWLAGIVDASAKELVGEDREEARSEVPTNESWDPRYAFLSEAMGIEPTQARRACIAFNVLPIDVRRAYYAVVVEGRTINRYVAEGNGPPDRVRLLLSTAINAIRAAIDPGEPPAGGTTHGR